ncbi:unnamed protein product [Blepharisma stoltei]|uniref:GINS subunit domain-containing protein n=1 Tax=Blepharisma stoltei TaxID=1481888 RepID=A0AAU9IGP2_9CILI|nr:unnamed protein product [Blepharisma stoltei]
MIKGSYWDIDDILAEEEPIPVKTTKELKGLGFLDITNKPLDLPAESRFQAPLWLAAILQRTETDIELPKYFRTSYRASLEADPSIVSLKAQSQYFFEVGTKLTEIAEDDDLKQLLLKVLMKRIKFLIGYIENKSNPNILKRLTELEISIYEKGRKTMIELEDWRERKYEKIRTSYLYTRPMRKMRLK